MGIIRYDSLPIVIDGKRVYYKTVKHTAASEKVLRVARTRWCDLKWRRQAPEHQCVKHEITSAREGSGEAPPQRMLKIQNSNLK